MSSAGLPSFPVLPIIPPELGQAVVAKPDGEGAVVAIVEVNSARAASAVGIELDSVLGEANPISTAGIDLSVIWPALWPSELGRIGLKVYFRK